MKIENIGMYVNFNKLLDKLSYLHTTETKYQINFDQFDKNTMILYYNKEKKEYNYQFELNDSKINLLFIGQEKLLYGNKIKTKAKFIKIIKNKIDSVITIMQKNGYSFNYKPEVGLFDLEMLSQEIDKINENEEKIEKKPEDLKKNKKILNQILLYHEILTQYLINEPLLKNNNYNLKIGSISNENLELFPKQDKYFSNVKLDVSAVPNIYFPGIIVIKINKTFDYKGISFSINYTGQELSKDIGLIAKNYYDSYKLNQDDRILNFGLKLVEIIKNPYNSENLSKKTGEQIITDSNCQKCGSSSSMFNVELSNVDIKTTMGKFETNALLPENILNHKDILSISCKECNNTIIKDKNLIDNIEKRRKYLGKENWISYKTGKPLLDSDGEEVVVKYDIVNLDVEFDVTNPMLPKLNYDRIINVGKLIGWGDIKLKRSKTFYDR